MGCCSLSVRHAGINFLWFAYISSSYWTIWLNSNIPDMLRISYNKRNSEIFHFPSIQKLIVIDYCQFIPQISRNIIKKVNRCLHNLLRGRKLLIDLELFLSWYSIHFLFIIAQNVLYCIINHHTSAIEFLSIIRLTWSNEKVTSLTI